MATIPKKLKKYINNIRKSGLTIYDPIERGDPDLWIPSGELEATGTLENEVGHRPAELYRMARRRAV